MIYLLEDDANIRNFVGYALNNSGLATKGFEKPSEFWKALDKEIPQLLLLDLMLPEEDGLKVLSKLRHNSFTKNLPVILLTAKGTEYDKVIGFDSGADDYITKPYNPMELVARVQSNLRRYLSLGAADSVKKSSVLRIGGLSLDRDEKQIYIDGEPVKLTATEFKITELLMENAGRVFSAEEIYSRVWNEDSYSVENTVMVHIRHIREKIEINPAEPRYLKVVWGIGYKISRE